MTTRNGDGLRRRVVLCGSMSSLGRMKELAVALEAAGFDAVVPSQDAPLSDWTLEASNEQKRAASLKHMEAIRDTTTAAVLVVNLDRNERRDYIGPNAFGEVAVAFSDRRPVFLLQGIPEGFASELLAWDAHPLHGDLRPLLAAVGGRVDLRVPTQLVTL